MKINDVNTKSFLGSSGAANNSYILINYAENNNSQPVTYKATLQEIGKAIIKDQKLISQDIDQGVVEYKTTSVSQNAYTKVNTNIIHPDNDYIIKAGSQIVPNVMVHNSRYDNPIGYYTTTASNSWTPVSTATPVEATVDETEYSYVLYNDSNGLITTDGNDGINSVPLVIHASGGEYNCIGMSDGGGLAIVTDSSGEAVELGRPMFYNDNTYQMGYYDSNGLFINHTVTATADAPTENDDLGVDPHYYVLHNPSFGFTIADSGGTTSRLYPFVSLNNNTYRFIGLSEHGGQAVIGDSQGVTNLGRPVFYNDTTAKLGYYNVNGSFISISN